MKCENCNKEHDGSYGSGRFCCESCARSYSRKSVKGGTKIVQCITCGKDIEVSKHASAKQCKCNDCKSTKSYGCKSRKSYDKGKKQIYCVNCGKKLVKKQWKYCNQNCQHEYKHKKYIERWKNGEEDGLSKGKKYISGHIVRYLHKKYDNKCAECGWDKKNAYVDKCMLDIHHIDGNRKNNKEENLILICPNCHSLTGNYRYINGKNRKHASIV